MTLYNQKHFEQFLQDTKGRWPEIAREVGVGSQLFRRAATNRLVNGPTLANVEKIMRYAHSIGWRYQPNQEHKKNA